MLVARVEEQLGVVGGGGQLARGREVLLEELVTLLAVDLHRYAGGPRSAERGDRDARVHEQGAAGTRAGLRQLLGDHHAEGEPGVDQAGAQLVGRRRSPLADRVEPGVLGEPEALLDAGEGAAVEQVGRVDGVAGAAQVVGEGPTPSVSPWMWW